MATPWASTCPDTGAGGRPSRRHVARRGRPRRPGPVFRIPTSDLERTIGLIREGAATAGRNRGPRSSGVLWWRGTSASAPICERRASARPSIAHPELYERWGLDAGHHDHVRSVVSAGGTIAATDLVSDQVADDISLPDPDPATVAEIGRSVGASAIAIRDLDTDAVPVGVEWARDVACRL